MFLWHYEFFHIQMPHSRLMCHWNVYACIWTSSTSNGCITSNGFL